MTNIQSKFLQPVMCSCKEFQHPWTDKCINAIAGLLLSSIPASLRIYIVVYALSLLMHNRIPTLEDLKRTALGITQSTAFLVTNSFTFIMYNCLLYNIIGCYYLPTVAFIPCFLSSLTAILVERPARRPLLTLYVANIATETLWNMAMSRGLVRSLPHGQTVIFGVSISVLLYIYRLGLHRSSCKDSLFNILRIFVGKPEEGPITKKEDSTTTTDHVSESDVSNSDSDDACSHPTINFRNIMGLVHLYTRIVNSLKSGKHTTCQHNGTCIKYSVLGGIKPFFGGVSLQVALKIIMNVKKIVQLKMDWRKTVFDRSTLKLGIFLGSFSFLYKSVSCLLRHTFDRDDPRFAIPAGLIGSLTFTQYPDTTVALYVMWKMLQFVYGLGMQKGLLPHVSNFTLYLYAFCVAILFHAGIVEPKTLRPSYMKFLQSVSGERFSKFNLVPLDVFGRETSKNSKEVMQKLNIINKSHLPICPMTV